MSSAAFEDRFSARAQQYSRYRPTYPPELFEYVASLAPARELAVDCGTGNGQAAIGLAAHFDKVLAVDGSDAQLARAATHPRVTYRVGRAEDIPADDGTVDLVVVAQALHWFDLDRFFNQTRRVLRPGGVLAVWGYELFRTEPEIEDVLLRFYHQTVGPYWSPHRRIVENGYSDVTLPFDELACDRHFVMSVRWSIDHVLGYLSSWSAVHEYEKQTGRNPLELVEPQLRAAWGPTDQSRELSWPVALRAGRKPVG